VAASSGRYGLAQYSAVWVDRADPVTLVVSAAVLLIAAMVAACLPAWRASRVDPMTALRHE